MPPDGSGPWPSGVALHEGLADDVRQHTDRFAGAGFVAVAPDLYTAGGAPRCIRTLMRRRETTFEDIDAVRRWLAGRDDYTGRVGVAGFCIGGGFALLAATRGFHASAPTIRQARMPYPPLRRCAALVRSSPATAAPTA